MIGTVDLAAGKMSGECSQGIRVPRLNRLMRTTTITTAKMAVTMVATSWSPIWGRCSPLNAAAGMGSSLDHC